MIDVKHVLSFFWSVGEEGLHPLLKFSTLAFCGLSAQGQISISSCTDLN